MKPVAHADRPAANSGDERLRRALEDLRVHLDASEYRTIYRLLGDSGFRRRLVRSLHQSLHRAPARTRTLFELLYLGGELRRARLASTFGGELARALEDVGILRDVGGGALRCPYKLELEGDLYLLTRGLLCRPDGVYYGEDSQFLAAVLEPREGEICLDPCTGYGVQGRRCAQRARPVLRLSSHVNYLLRPPASRQS